MKNGKEFLLTDTVGFIQKLPTTLVRKIPLTIYFALGVIQIDISFYYFDMIYNQIKLTCFH